MMMHQAFSCPQLIGSEVQTHPSVHLSDSSFNGFKRSGWSKPETPTSVDHIVVTIPKEEVGVSSLIKNPSIEFSEMESLKSASQFSNFTPMSSLETSSFVPSPNRPPKIPTSATLTRRKTLAMSAYAKPKSRFVEPTGPIVSTLLADDDDAQPSVSFSLAGSKKVSFSETLTPRGCLRSRPVTPRTPIYASPSGDEEDGEEEIFKLESAATKMEKSRKKWKVISIIEWISLVCIWGVLITSITVEKFQGIVPWGLEIWKWCVLVMVLVCGHLMVVWLIHVLIFLIEHNFLLKNKVLYFIYGVKNSVMIFLWLCLVLITWALLIIRGVKRSKHEVKILNEVTKGLIASMVGSLIWMINTLLVKLLATNFQCSRFFDRIQESLFHQYVLKTLSGPPVMEIAETIGTAQSSGQFSFRSTGREKKGREEVIDVNKLHKLKQEKVSSWTMKGLINVVTTSGLSTITNEIDQMAIEAGQQMDCEITNEWEAKAAAYKIFRNVGKPNTKYIDVEDLLRFLSKAEVRNVLPLFEGAAEIGKIKKSSLKNWVVKVYNDRKSLAHSLNDTETAVSQLNNILSALMIVIIIIVWLLIMGIATIKVLVFISSQTLVVAFMFGNTAKTIFESIIFVFVMHPFDVGDRCVIDGVQMVVEEMNILTTVFLRYDNEKIYYPNSVLATKPISNFYRSPDMGDGIDFTVDVSTSVESIGAIKARIKTYIESKPHHWRPAHMVVVKDIENMNMLKMAVYLSHTMNHQNFGEKVNRRADLVIELKKIFEELSIKYHLPPQEVHLTYVGSAATTMPNFGR